MYLVVIGWMYVVGLWAVMEATASNGTVLGALVTLVLWGLLPVSLVMYAMGTPARRRARLQAEAASVPAQPDESDHAAAAPHVCVPPEREEP
jgi:hypothetical protein